MKNTTGCISKIACHETCTEKPDDEFGYRCNWNSSMPTCEQHANGTMTNDECNKMCNKDQYAKCDFEKNECVACELGEKDCSNTKDFCDVI